MITPFGVNDVTQLLLSKNTYVYACVPVCLRQCGPVCLRASLPLRQFARLPVCFCGCVLTGLCAYVAVCLRFCTPVCLCAYADVRVRL